MITDGEFFEILATFLDSDDSTSSEATSELEETSPQTTDENALEPYCDLKIETLNSTIVGRLKKSLAKRTKYTRPRMINSDIRDSYGIMFANTFNSCDMSMIGGMCERYYLPNVNITIKKQVTNGPELVTIIGLGPVFIANLLYSVAILSPDSLSTLKNSIFKASCGEVNFTFYFSSTKVYNVPSILEVLPNMVVEKEQAEGLISDPNSSTLSNDVIVESLERIKSHLPMRKNPVKVVCRCVVRMKTNERKQVEDFKMSIYNVDNVFEVEK